MRRMGAIALAGLIAVLAAVAVSVAAAKPRGRPRRPRAAASISLEWVGDIALSTQRGLPPGGLVSALAPVAKLLQGADLTTGNLEGTLSVSGPSKCGAGVSATNCYAFQAPPSTAFALRTLGFDLVNQANNHSMDFGLTGREQTVAALDAAGIAHTGFPGEITYLRVHGIRLAFLGFAPYAYDSNLLDIPAARALVARARSQAAIVVVFIHAGAEGAGELHVPYGPQFYLGEDRGDARAFAHAVIDAGATIVLGSGPHVIRGVERVRGRLVAYSLGNFVGYNTLGGGGVLNDSGIMRVTFDPQGRLLAARWIPIVLVGGLPRPDPSDASAHLVTTLSDEDFPTDHFDIEPDGTFSLPGDRRRASPKSPS